MDPLGRRVLESRVEAPVSHPQVSPEKRPRRKMQSDGAVLIVAEQSRDAFRRRRAIREAFHDSKAVTVKKKAR
jgi:hypothetical protein